MLGVIGFAAAIIAILVFVASFWRAYPRLDKNTSFPFLTAFLMLASVMALSMIGVLSDNIETLQSFIIVIDVVLIIATGFLLSILLPIKNPIVMTLLTVLAGMLLVLRIVHEPSTATIEDGILHFNLEGGTRFVLMAGLFGIWFPASYVVARKAIATVHLEYLSGIIGLAYVMLVVSAGIFFAARTHGMIIISFSALVVTFLSIAGCNIALSRLAKISFTQKGHHHAGRK